MLTKQHFEAIAKILNPYTKTSHYNKIECKAVADYQIHNIIKNFADYLETQNPNFNTHKFIEACNN